MTHKKRGDFKKEKENTGGRKIEEAGVYGDGDGCLGKRIYDGFNAGYANLKEYLSISGFNETSPAGNFKTGVSSIVRITTFRKALWNLLLLVQQVQYSIIFTRTEGCKDLARKRWDDENIGTV